MPTFEKKIRLGVSRCLTGANCRYDGRSKPCEAVLQLMQRDDVELVCVCPECEANYGIPHEAMHVEWNESHTALELITNESRQIVSDKMRAFLPRKIAELTPLHLDGFILKSKSPSCGITSTPTFAPGGKSIESMNCGFFTAALQQAFPDLPLWEEGDIEGIFFLGEK